MHIVLTNGKHPLYDNWNKGKESIDELKRNILQCKKVQPD
jgi:hypothetical protein